MCVVALPYADLHPYFSHQCTADDSDPERCKRLYGVRVPEEATVARVSDG